MTVETYHPDYEAWAARWVKCRDVVSGQNAVKDKGELYLPKPSGLVRDKKHGDADYDNYKKRASFVNASKVTVNNLVGLLFAKPVVGSDIEYIPTDNMDGDSNSIDGHHKKILKELLTTSRVGLWVDYDNHREQIYTKIYRTEGIIDWGYDDSGNLEMIKLLSARIERNMDGKAYRQRILRELLLESGVYVVRNWEERENDKKELEWMPDSYNPEVVPTDASGAEFEEIPFTFLNNEKLDSEINDPLLEGLFDVNLAHYINSADREWCLHWAAQPTPWGAGLNEEEASQFVTGPTGFIHSANSNFKMGILEFSGNAAKALREAMDDKEKQMVVLGAKVLELPKLGVEAAETIQMRLGGDQSNLAQVADASVQGMHWIINTMLVFQSREPQEINYELDRSGLSKLLDPAFGKWLVESWQQGAISDHVMRYNFERGNLYPNNWSAEDEKSFIENGGVIEK